MIKNSRIFFLRTIKFISSLKLLKIKDKLKDATLNNFKRILHRHIFESEKYRIIYLSAALFLCFDIGVLIPNFILAADLQEYSLIINLSGRQRMLSQRIAKTLLQIQIRKQQNQEINEQIDELAQAYQLFDQTLTGFQIGQNVKGSDEILVFLPKVESSKGRELVNKAQKIWDVYKIKIESIISSKKSFSQQDLESVIHYSNANNLKLLDLMNQLTTETQNISNHKAFVIQVFQTMGLILALINFFILFYQSLQKLKGADAQVQNALNQLEKTQMQLVQNEKMTSLGQLVAGMAHELNNPINFISPNIPLAQEYVANMIELIELYQKYYPYILPEINEFAESIDIDFIKSDLPKILQSIKTGTNRIHDIVLSLRTFSHLDKSEIKTINVHDNIDSILKIIQGRLNIQSNRAAIAVMKKYDQLPLVECYAAKLNQVILNLLTNAIDALELIINPISPEIYIQTKLLKDNYILISIADNGIGISVENQQRIFDPFFTTKPVGKGTGLGLSISYQIIVEEHHGELNCISTPGRGTEFQIKIPIKQGLILSERP